MPRAYLVAQVEVHDPEAYVAYRSRTGEIVAKYGGRFIARGGSIDALEGTPPGSRVVIIEFPTMEKAREWYDSPEYQDVLPHRTRNATSILYLVEGTD